MRGAASAELRRAPQAGVELRPKDGYLQLVHNTYVVVLRHTWSYDVVRATTTYDVVRPCASDVVRSVNVPLLIYLLSYNHVVTADKF